MIRKGHVLKTTDGTVLTQAIETASVSMTRLEVSDSDYLRLGHILTDGVQMLKVVQVPYRLPKWLRWLYRFAWARRRWKGNTITVERLGE